jgi:hypothetical protein
MKLKNYMPAAVAILASTAFAGYASAGLIDNINGSALPGPYTDGNDELGWVYSPAVSYMLSGISVNFSAVGNGDTVTLSFWSGLPSSGGTELGSGAVSGGGFQGITFGTDIPVVAGDAYFVGLSPTSGTGVPIAAPAFLVTSATPAAPGVTYIPSGFYIGAAGANFPTNVPLVYTSCPGDCDNAFAAPIIDFFGSSTSGTPEPGTMALSVTGIMALLLALRGRRHAASRQVL